MRRRLAGPVYPWDLMRFMDEVEAYCREKRRDRGVCQIGARFFVERHGKPRVVIPNIKTAFTIRNDALNLCEDIVPMWKRMKRGLVKDCRKGVQIMFHKVAQKLKEKL